MTKQAWVIKQKDGSYVDKHATDYADDITEAHCYDTEAKAQHEIDAGGGNSHGEHAVEVCITIEEIST